MIWKAEDKEILGFLAVVFAILCWALLSWHIALLPIAAFAAIAAPNAAVKSGFALAAAGFICAFAYGRYIESSSTIDPVFLAAAINIFFASSAALLGLFLGYTWRRIVN